jgi:hypothetical protein
MSENFSLGRAFPKVEVFFLKKGIGATQHELWPAQICDIWCGLILNCVLGSGSGVFAENLESGLPAGATHPL